MKLKYKLVITDVAGETVAVPLDIEGGFNGAITINETMKDILELLAVDRDEDELTMAMMQKYKNVSQEEMKKAVHNICVDLKKEGILE